MYDLHNFTCSVFFAIWHFYETHNNKVWPFYGTQVLLQICLECLVVAMVSTHSGIENNKVENLKLDFKLK